MKLSKLVQGLSSESFEEREISGLSNDSRRVGPGDLFIAYPGAASDGRDYIETAFAAGAAAAVYEPAGFHLATHDTRCIAISGLAEHLADLAGQFYEYPSRFLDVTGITGTNGKTTIAWQLTQAHELLGNKAAYIGTIGQGCIDDIVPLANTTPDALQLQHLLQQYRLKSVRQVCMEVSSHALSQGRVGSTSFSQAIFTNLSHDHLDYHHTMAAYAEAKALLFRVPSLKYAIINHDDAYGLQMSAACASHCQQLTYGFGEGSSIRALNCRVSHIGSACDVVSPWGHYTIHTQLIGAFNIYNVLAIFASLMTCYDDSRVVQVISQLTSSPGRMERVVQEPCVLVDYAHTPDALANVLTTLHALKQGKLIVVFGCGGDRDKTKRPKMGAIASQYADHVIITSDNPRSEEPDCIIDEIMGGVKPGASVTRLVCRKEAIHRALSQANTQDIVLIAGKGHENYQEIGAVRYPFSDQQVVRDFITPTTV